eukprot:1189155-Prorocentrum_minimum.AAC.2
MEQGKQEAERLARARLRHRDEVRSAEHDGPALRLDGRGRREAAVPHSHHQPRVERQLRQRLHRVGPQARVPNWVADVVLGSILLRAHLQVGRKHFVGSGNASRAASCCV